MIEYSKPLPKVDEASRIYWDTCKENRLVIQKCQACGVYQTYPRIVCYKCLSDKLDWVESAGRGIVYSFTVIYHAEPPGFESDIPYVIALVELNEGIRMMSNIIDCAPEDVRIGMGVEVVFDAVTAEITLPKFKPVKA